MMKVLLLLCAFGVVLSQVPRPCNSPSQWAGRERRVNFKMQYEERSIIFYDELNRRSRTFAEIDLGSNKTFYDHLHLYNENKNYTINALKKTCTLSPIQHPWRYRGVHPNARFEFTAALGGTGIPGESITVQLFSANETDTVYTGMVTYPGCIPVHTTYYSPKYGLEQHDFYDIALGISVPEVFIPPEECRGLTL